MRGAPPLVVNEVVAAQMRDSAAARSAEYRAVVRARIILDAIAGVSNEENARRNATRPDTVRKTRRRAESAASAAEALADATRSGRPARIALGTRATLVQIACARPTPELAKERVRARLKEARAARKAAARRRKEARAMERRAERRVTAGERDASRKRRDARRAVRRADKDFAVADLALARAAMDAARPAKEHRPSFSAVWTHRALQVELTRQTGATMSLSEIRRTLWCGGLRPHRVRLWLHSPDPDFKVKVKALCELYLAPPPGAVVLSVDEKSGMQIRSDLHPMRSQRRGDMRREFEYVRGGTKTLIAALDIRTGEVFGYCRRRTAEGINAFLEELARKYPSGDVYIVWDNLNVHRGGAIDAFNERHGGRFHFVYTPLHASWMNQIEIWFSILQRRVLKYGSFSSGPDLEAAVMGFIRHWNLVERRPFRWRFRGDFAPRVPWAA